MLGVTESQAHSDEPRISKRDLRKYVTGAPLDPDVWTWINLQVKGDDNSVKLQVAEMRARMKEPFAVDWGSLAATPDEDCGSEPK